MVSVKASDWKNVMNLDTEISDTKAEYVLDLAIDTLNIYGASLSNMTGATAGSKTVTLTSKQRGAVFQAARVIYYGFFKEIESAGVGPLTVTTTDLASNPALIALIKEIAKRLASVPFVVAHDTSGIT